MVRCSHARRVYFYLQQNKAINMNPGYRETVSRKMRQVKVSVTMPQVI
jgi:hypothetical protein